MNKTAIRLFVFLLLILFVSLSAYSMDWEVHENVDLFGDFTGEYYISLPSKNIGFYSTEYSQNVEFKWDCSFDEQGHLSLYFFESNGRSLIPLTGDQNSELSIKFQDGTVKQYSVEINTTHYKKNEIITKESVIKDIKDTEEIKIVFREGFSVYNLGRLRTENISEALSNIKNYADILALLSDGYLLDAYVSSFSIEGIDCSTIRSECRIRIRNTLEENIEITRL